MQAVTFLDAQIIQIMEEGGRLGKHMTVKEARATARDVVSSSESVRLEGTTQTAEQSINELSFDAAYIARVHGDKTLAFQYAVQNASLRPFYYGYKEAVAIQVTPPLLDVFRGAQSYHTAAVMSLLLSRPWYLDFMHAPITFHYAGQTRYLRALFCNPYDGLTRDLTYCRTQYAPEPPVLAFFDNGHQPIGMDFQYWFKGRDWRMSERLLLSRELYENVETLMDLILLYYSTLVPDTLPYLPRSNPKHLEQRKPLNQARMLASESLFRVIRLAPPADNFGRKDVSTAHGSWTLDHEVPVRGHFRLQHFGAENAQQKIIWVGSYSKGPKGVPAEQGKLYRLKVPPSAPATKGE